MKQEYQNLNDLLCANRNAKDFYLRQPENVQGRLQQHTHSIHSLEGMHRCAQEARGISKPL